MQLPQDRLGGVEQLRLDDGVRRRQREEGERPHVLQRPLSADPGRAGGKPRASHRDGGGVGRHQAAQPDQGLEVCVGVNAAQVKQEVRTAYISTLRTALQRRIRK